MERLRKTAGILLTVLEIIMLLFAAGTVIPELPVFGSVANFVTVGFQHIWLPLSAAVFLTALLTLILSRRRRAKHAADAVMSFITLALAVITALDLAAAVRSAGVQPNLFPVKEDVSSVTTETEVYTKSASGDVLLNVYHVDDGKTGKPVMIFIHGGGWIFGSREDHEYYSKVFALSGYVVISADYDVSTKETHLASSTEAQLTEAFAWVRKNAARYGGDCGKLYVTGGSAGGNLAIDISFKINSGVYSTSADGTELPKVKAVSVTFPVCDPADFYRNSDLVFSGTARNMAFCYTGASPEEDPEIYRSVTPVNFLTKDAPAVNILVGSTDTLVPPGPTYELAQAMNGIGAECQVITIPRGNHMFEMADGGMGCNAYLQTSLRWFEQHS